MRRLFQFTALLVLALWLPTTVHCNLEAMLDWAVEDCCGTHADDSVTPVEHCGVEDGGYRITDASVTVGAPELLTFWCGDFVRVVPAGDVPAPRNKATESPPELARRWQFVARAALPVRAPSRVS